MLCKREKNMILHKCHIMFCCYTIFNYIISKYRPGVHIPPTEFLRGDPT